MITSLTLWDANITTSITLNSATYPLEKFSWDYPIDGANIPKGQTSGQWDTFKYVRKMDLTCEGHILADTTSGYWTARKALLAIAMPQPDTLVKFHSRILMVVDDGATVYRADVNLAGFAIPLEALYPTVTPFQFQWECNVGYWRDNATLIEKML